MEGRHKNLMDALFAGATPEKAALAECVESADGETREYAATLAREVTLTNFGDAVFVRGLVEFTNHCRNDCFYCGIRKGNAEVARYRLTLDEILDCCREGYGLGFRTFVLQGGEDGYFTDDRLTAMVEALRREFPDCALTLSVGERDAASYERLFRTGADRYLLRHETADARHYGELHPEGMALDSRVRCLRELKRIGFQVGAGFMVGSPGQTPEHLAGDLLFLRDLKPEMVGLGPFLPHADTPFARFPAGDVEMVLFMISLVRLILPFALLPATTALGTACAGGRERGILAGANVVMPNLSPPRVRDSYSLYDGKLNSGLEAAENVAALRQGLAAIGRRVVVDRGDYSGVPRLERDVSL